nr:MAG TPA: hypothetical protein [Caudoviricetes sp.]
MHKPLVVVNGKYRQMVVLHFIYFLLLILQPSLL